MSKSTIEIATIIGNITDGALYGFYENFEDTKRLETIIVVAQDGPIGSPLTLDIQLDGVTKASVVFPADSQPAGEEQQLVYTLPSAITIPVGSIIRLLATGSYPPASNVKIFGIICPI